MNITVREVPAKLFQKILLFVIAMVLPLNATAQFFLAGDDPGKVRWRTKSTENYQLIYPSGMDSLAMVYGTSLETWHKRVGQTGGYLPGEWTKGKIPVVLHGYHAVSNGSVAWAPKRMDLYLSPDAYHPTPMPWILNLAIHEQRHVCQMQTGYAYAMKPFKWFFGEMLGAGVSVFYGGQTWMEGDAVVAETALSHSGRGRQASFMNYYMVSFDQGVWRDWFSWKNGSQRWYSPNYYAAGYMLLSGIRYNHNLPDISGMRFRDFSHHPWHWGMNHILKEQTGLGQDACFWESAASHYALWAQNAQKRAPYMEYTQMVSVPRWYTKYSGNIAGREGVYSVKESLVRTPSLIVLKDNGHQKRLRAFSATASGLQMSADSCSLIWSETVKDPRWDLRSKSVVRSYDIQTKRTRTISRKGQVYNPAPHCGQAITGSRYEYEGSTGVCIIDQDTISAVKAPDGCQVVETASIDGTVYASILSDEGFGICHLTDAGYEYILNPHPVTIAEMKSRDGKLWFCSDRNGVDELYCLEPENGRLFQVTSTRYGSRDHTFSADGSELWYSLERLEGRLLCKTPIENLLWKEVNFADNFKWEIADTLSAQEARLSDANEIPSVEFSEEKPYRKIAHLIHLHSWAPAYFSYDNIKNISFDRYYESIAPGLCGLFQNNLGTFTMTAGYSAHPDSDKGPWRHSGHMKMTYSGWYPVIEAELDFNDRRAHETFFKAITTDGHNGVLKNSSRILNGTPQVYFSASSYIPWSFGRGGWYGGIIPKIRYTVSNDRYSTAPEWYLEQTLRTEDGQQVKQSVYLWHGSGWKYINQSITASLRGYCTMNTAPSGIYPRFGVGAEVGLYTHLAPGGLVTTKGERPLFSPQAYGYMYMYLPGIIAQQGLKISAKYGRELRSGAMFGSTAVNNLPRGLESNSSLLSLVCMNGQSLLLSADYGIPVWIGDIHIAKGFAYIQRLVFTPHFDYTRFWQNTYKGELLSAGLDLSIKFTTLAWIMAPFEVGVRLDYNGGRSFEDIKKTGMKIKHFYVGPLFSISF